MSFWKLMLIEGGERDKSIKIILIWLSLFHGTS